MWLNGVIVQLSFLFEQSNTPLGHILVVTIFAKKKKGYIYPCFFAILFIQFSKTVKAVRNESTWILNLLENWKIGISSGFSNFYSCSRLFRTVQHILVSVFCLFLHFSLMLTLPLDILICIFGMCTCLALSLPFQFFQFCHVSRFFVFHFMHIISVTKS